MALNIRRMDRYDLPGVIELETQSMGPVWDDDGIEYDPARIKEFIEIRIDIDDMWVVEEHGKIIGFLHSTEYTDAISSTKVREILTISIHPDHFGRGIGGKLLDIQRSKAVEDGVNILKLETLSSNKKAIEFYRKKGFKERKKIMISEIGD